MSSNKQQQGKYPLHDIVSPHDHDVLSGRGNFVNYHAGNEHFRALVRKHKVAYVACPKPQKGKFSRMIVDEIRNRNPPGRFLKQDPNTKLWHDIGEKKALDKTRQALREGAPEISKELTGDEEPEPHGMQNSVLKVRSYFFSTRGRLICRRISTTSRVEVPDTFRSKLINVISDSGPCSHLFIHSRDPRERECMA